MPKTTFYYGDGQATVTTAPTANDRDYGPSSVIYVVNYAFASGADSSWLMNSSNNLTFTIKRSRMDDLTFGNVAGVFVDDTAVPDSSFGLEQGSAVITLSAEYMKTLAEGKHSFRVEFTDPYTVTTSFTIVKASPQTGEFASPMLIVLSGMFLAAVAAFVVKSRKA
ncbi:MAG: LPXTG cell wall anchor domain-containing protein [Saccharofermentans sp.]|nr:LPXTG cell wall anchor domain-containing protein [Saccharofermentans sp.]